jgi:alanyl aminopeptidase
MLHPTSRRKARLVAPLILSIGLLGLAACSGNDSASTSESGDPETSSQPSIQSSAKPPPDAIPTGRLPEGAAPLHYRLNLNIDPREADFSGHVEIDIKLDRPTQGLWLHGNRIEVSQAFATVAGGDPIDIDYQQVADVGVARLEFSETLPAGTATLVFHYTAPFNTSLEGLYRIDNGGNSYAYTQFESTSARLAFPAFDEPAYKVGFDISLTIPEQFVGITNTPLLEEKVLGDGNKHLRFAATKPLPTYLIAFAVGPFDVVEWQPVAASELRAEPIPLRGVTTQGKGEQIRFALENTEKILLGLEDYFATPYPYAKLDIIAVPDFAAGAMENAGAITYREQLLLMDENSPVRQRRAYFGVHAHELAHQWFGNLVTPVWWDDIWLNESFATWNATAVLHNLFPEENYRDSLHARASAVMRQDSLASARQIREPILRHEDIGSAFNGITYQKGGAVLNMFESFIGEENFRNGIRSYMQLHAWGNTTADDFINAIADANPQIDGDDLRQAFRSYIEQPGLPLVKAELICSDQAIELEMSQQRYLPTGSTGSIDETWTIPACVTMKVDGAVIDRCFLVKDQSQRVNPGIESCPDYILPNAHGASYYRWSLPADQWQDLLEVMGTLDTAEQISVAGSLSAALNANELSIDEFLSSVPTIAQADSWRVATAPLADIRKIMDFVATAEDRKALQAQLVEWYQPRLDELNRLTQPSSDQIQFQAVLQGVLALTAKDEALRLELRDQAIAYAGYEGDSKIHEEAVDANQLDTALLVAVDELGKPYVDLLWEHFLNSTDMTQRQSLLGAMAYSAEPEVAATMRDRILSPELKSNEIYYIIGAQTGRAESRDDLWLWIQQNMDPLLALIPIWRQGGLIRFVGTFCSEEKAAELEAVFNPFIRELGSGPRTLANTTEGIRLCAAFADAHKG